MAGRMCKHGWEGSCGRRLLGEEDPGGSKSGNGANDKEKHVGIEKDDDCAAGGAKNPCGEEVVTDAAD
jgi:hypothetical protein